MSEILHFGLNLKFKNVRGTDKLQSKIIHSLVMENALIGMPTLFLTLVLKRTYDNAVRGVLGLQMKHLA